MVDSQPPRYPCSPGGTIAAGQRRLASLLMMLSILLAGAALAAWWGGQWVPGLLAMAVVLVIATAWRMAGELQPRWLELQKGLLVIQTKRHRVEIAIAGAEIRALDGEQVRHLERLTSSGGFVAGAGGFDSHLLGEFDLYASNLQNALFVRAPEARLVITPDAPREFLEAFREAATAPATIHAS